MNSLNILSSHVSPSAGSSPSRSNSVTGLGLAALASAEDRNSNSSSKSSKSSSNSNANSDSNSNGGSNSGGRTGTIVQDRKTSFGYDSTEKAKDDGSGSGRSFVTIDATGSVDETSFLLSQKDSCDNYGAGTTTAGRPATTSSSLPSSSSSPRWCTLPRDIALTVLHSVRWVLQTLTAPGVYLLACFCDENGHFAPLTQLKMVFGRHGYAKQGSNSGTRSSGSNASKNNNSKNKNNGNSRRKAPAGPFASDAGDESTAAGFTSSDEKSLRRLSTESDASATPSWTGRAVASSFPVSSYAMSSESESDIDHLTRGGMGRSDGTERSSGAASRRRGTNDAAGNRRATTGSRSGEEDSAGASSAGNRRSVRIKLNDDTSRQRKHHRKGQSSSSGTMRGGGGSGGVSGGGSSMGGGGGGASGGYGAGAAGPGGAGMKDILAQLKSPTSPAGALTRYPRTPAPPRPLIPRRQPSYLNLEPLDRSHQKTLILDLDETLIHSMSKGGRMSTGHMVEVRLNTTFVGMGGQPSLGPQHPILYYVHKRPYCDEFLRRVCKWYNLVVFTASVQEYADPVIDWLESERKFFSARYYRQHCTFRHGAFIKDLSAVEPDLSKVMILDNSPLSYMFHQDNAIPIQGWISDHTDNDLLHLVPMLEALQYVSDVRALLALRGGEDGRHMA